MNKILSRKAIKLISVTILISLASACSVPMEREQYDQPLDKWTDGQLLEQASKDFARKNYQDSYGYLFQLSKRNNKEGLYALGYSYYYGLGIEKNEATAQDLIRQSAALGYKPAIKALRLFMASKIAFVSDTKKASYMAHGDDKSSKVESEKISSSTDLAQTDQNKEYSSSKINLAKATTTSDLIPSSTSSKSNLAVKQNKMKLDSLQEIIDGDLSKDKLAVKTESQNTLITSDEKPSANIAANERKSPIDRIIKSHTIPKTEAVKKVAEVNNKSKDFWKGFEEFHNEPSIDPQAKSLVANKISRLKIKQAEQPSIELSKKPVTQPESSQNTAWLKSQDPNSYTIQITASKNKEEVNKFIIANNLQAKAEAYAYLNDDKVWYGVGMGVYDNQSDAYKALLKDVPSNAKGNKPWVRQFKNIRAIG